MSSAFGVLDKNIIYALKIKFLKEKEFIFPRKGAWSMIISDLFLDFFVYVISFLTADFFTFNTYFCIVYRFLGQA